jgi:hypothetical protein
MKNRWTAAVAGALMAVVLVLAGAAFADDISNALDPSVDAVAEVMPLTVGGANGSTTLYLVERNGDGKNGCNLTGSTTLALSVASSNPAVATVSPSLVTFASCGDVKTLTVLPVAQGSTTISVSETSNTTEGTFNLVPATFTVTVAASSTNTAPHISVAGVTGGASYDKGSVPAATCQVTDAEDGNTSFAATLGAVTGAYATDGIGSQTASCSYTDQGGLAASASETYGIVDPSAPIIGYTLSPSSPDGQNGWYTGNVTLTWSVDDPQSPNSLLTTGCVDQNITADQAEATYSCAASSAGGTASQVHMTIKRDGSAPSVSVVSVKNADDTTYTPGTSNWTNQAVTVDFSCADNGPSGVAGISPDPVTLATEGEAQSAGTTCTDNAGNSAGGSEQDINIDLTAPSVIGIPAGPPNGDNGWYTSDVTINWTCFDALSLLLDACAATTTISSEGTALTSSLGPIHDNAGNATTGLSSPGVKIDKTPPLISPGVTPAASDGQDGWYVTAPTVKFTCSDATSLIASCAADDAAPSDELTLGESASAQTVTGTATDNAGNSNTASSAALKVDLSNPTAPSWTGSIGDGASFYFGSVPPLPTCSATDAISGFKGCVVGGYSNQVGTHTLTATATDNAGRTSTATRTYNVLAWTLKGFYQPTDMGGVFNTVKNGSTVPLKFQIFAGSAELSTTSSVKSLTSAQVACNSTALTDDIELTATGATTLRYDSTGGQFVYNWQTPKTAGICYRVTMTTQDGSSLVAFFKLK